MATNKSVLEIASGREVRNTSSGYQVNLGLSSNSLVRQDVSGYSVELSSPIRVRTQSPD
jgi:hypothetical protein